MRGGVALDQAANDVHRALHSLRQRHICDPSWSAARSAANGAPHGHRCAS
ncbi:hypothetical protein BURMUCF1_A1377 [Burkholderia multivorans ATCC BAA-247]|uniref:Uncharacterized protein n=1 Tax=Burkholderia multivorans CGD2 TaxID=513052 RepID=B9BK02_9BURK|nr:hypothetical protein BURMUCGD2_5408 [Burkholderia multivorans CGD2]EEE15955.1 hypothetical protein BURMUCGD2M_5398 [Burkholderia multivorans CGD2M]EJO53797.1 hypothetical protein BURMUCF1_A1377 [Burkholderia multivorans ATCC BAA-247]